MFLKKLFHREKKSPMIYWLAAIVALLAVIGLLITFNSLHLAQLERDAALQKVKDEEQQMTAALQTLRDAAPIAGLARAVTFANGLAIATQEEGQAVIVDTVVMDATGFVGVYDDNGKGSAGTLLNTSPLLMRGAYHIVSIAVPKKLTAGKNYFLRIIQDTNTNQQFDPKDDQLVLTESGSPLEVSFTVKKATRR